MSKIRLDADHTLVDGESLTFNAPCDCNKVDGIIVYYPNASGKETSKAFCFTDSHGNDLTGLGNLFMSGAHVKVVLDTVNSRAFLQNADTNAYLEDKIGNIASITNVKHYTNLEQIGLSDAELSATDVKANLHSIYNKMDNYAELWIMLHSGGNPNLWNSLYTKWESDIGESPSYKVMHVKMIRRSYTLEVYVTMQGHPSNGNFDSREYSCMFRAGNTVEISYLSAFTIIRDKTGFVSKSGDKMNGNLAIEKSNPTIKLDHTSGYGGVAQVYNNMLSLFALSDYVASTGGDYRRLSIYNLTGKSSVKDALTILEKDSTGTKSYRLLHEGNKDLITPADIGAATETDVSNLISLLSGYSRIATGSYVGTGTYGEANPNTLTFPFTPKVVFIDGATFFQGDDSPLHLGSHTIGYSCVVTWGTNSVSWYSTAGSANNPVASQGNTERQTYRWVALG